MHVSFSFRLNYTLIFSPCRTDSANKTFAHLFFVPWTCWELIFVHETCCMFIFLFVKLIYWFLSLQNSLCSRNFSRANFCSCDLLKGDFSLRETLKLIFRRFMKLVEWCVSSWNWFRSRNLFHVNFRSWNLLHVDFSSSLNLSTVFSHCETDFIHVVAGLFLFVILVVYLFSFM